MHDTLCLFKTLADETRLKIIRSLSEKDLYVELLAERLQLSPATISFHMKKLMAAGLVDARREQYYTVYSLRRDVFDCTLKSFLFQKTDESASEELREEMYRRKVLKSFLPNGYCETMPAQVKKRFIVYEEIFKQFDASRTYTEKEVNAVIGHMHADYCTVRRGFIGLGWMTRSDGVYTVNPNPDRNNYADLIS